MRLGPLQQLCCVLTHVFITPASSPWTKLSPSSSRIDALALWVFVFGDKAFKG